MIERKIKEFFEKNKGYLKVNPSIVCMRMFNKIDENTRNKVFQIQKEMRSEKKVLKNKDTKNTRSTKNTHLKPYTKGNKDNVLVIGDLHIPFEKEGYLEFCRKIQEEYNCGTVVFIGDIVDNHAMSYHEHNPNGKSIGDEYKLSLDKCAKWYSVFPVAKVTLGNHDVLPFRKAVTHGFPKEWLKTYEEMLQSPKTWEWDFVHIVKNVIYQHGTGMSGEMASINAARENRQSTVIGHLHTVMNTRYLASYKDLIFGVSVGCGINHKEYAFAYGKENTRKPVIACAVVLNGKLPINIPMEI